MEIDFGSLLMIVLEIIITVVLPFILKLVIEWLNVKIREGKAAAHAQNLDVAIALVRQMVLAAEQMGLTDAIKNIGEEKKAFVISMAEKALAERGIKMDLDELDALIEAQVKDAIKDLEDPLAPYVV